MTVLYMPVRIESVEQAEALPVGTTVTHPDYWPREKGNLLGSWEGPGDAMQNAEMVGFTALVPIEAEEEFGAGGDGMDEDFYLTRRLVTPWEEA